MKEIDISTNGTLTITGDTQVDNHHYFMSKKKWHGFIIPATDDQTKERIKHALDAIIKDSEYSYIKVDCSGLYFDGAYTTEEVDKIGQIIEKFRFDESSIHATGGYFDFLNYTWVKRVKDQIDHHN